MKFTIGGILVGAGLTLAFITNRMEGTQSVLSSVSIVASVTGMILCLLSLRD